MQYLSSILPAALVAIVLGSCCTLNPSPLTGTSDGQSEGVVTPKERPLATPAPIAPTRMRASLKETTPKTLARDYAIERKGRPVPRLGLSLSGGGTRAAHFAHGVLQGINDSGLLARVDVISSVSGGSYAAYWYFTKRLEARREGFQAKAIFADCLPTWWVDEPTTNETVKTLQHLMSLAQNNRSQNLPVCGDALHWETGDPYRWQAHLARWPDLFGIRPGIVNGDRQGKPIKPILTQLTAVFAGFAECPHNDARAQEVYQYGIERVWGLNPRPRQFPLHPNPKNDRGTQWRYTNQQGDQWNWDMHVDPKNDWQDLEEATVGKAQFPLWIINATNGQNMPRKPDASNIYEMTALAHGMQKQGYGYIEESPALMGGVPYGVSDLGTATRASAAFVDAQGVVVPWWRKLMELNSNFRWGLDVEDRFSRNAGGPGKTLHLSDGGGSENLGLYSLIKRGIPDIIVVDAEYDIIGRMEGLCRVRKLLADEGLEMKFENTLENFDQVCATHFTTGDETVLAYNTSAWRNPVIEGSVTWPDPAMPKTRLWLVKLGWNEDDLERAFHAKDCGSQAHPVNCLLTVFYGHNTEVRNTKDHYMHFPQLRTQQSTLDLSSYLFWGYRELGRMVASKLVWDDAGGGRLRLDPAVVPCKQEAIKITRAVADRNDQRPVCRPGGENADQECQSVRYTRYSLFLQF